MTKINNIKYFFTLFLLLVSCAYIYASDYYDTRELVNVYIDGRAINDISTIGGQAITTVPADVTVYPTSDGNALWTCSSGTDRFAMVDEESQDGDTTYIYRQDSGVTQTFDNKPTLPNGTILGVGLYYYGKEQTGNTTGGARITVNGTDYTDANEAMTAAYVEYSHEWTVNPNTSAAWVKEDVEGTGSNPLQTWGVTPAIGAGEEMRITQIRLVIRYN